VFPVVQRFGFTGIRTRGETNIRCCPQCGFKTDRVLTKTPFRSKSKVQKIHEQKERRKKTESKAWQEQMAPISEEAVTI